MGVTEKICTPISLNVKTIDPESLTGLLQNISDIGTQHLPNIFRFWQTVVAKKTKDSDFTFSNFVKYFNNQSDTRKFSTLNNRNEEFEVSLHNATFNNVSLSLNVAVDFFDNPNTKFLDESDILQKEKMSVINVTGSYGIRFGSILLRHLLNLIVSAKNRQEYSDVPILIIIDEVHQFYHSDSSLEALGYLDTICRTGRSKKIGVIFSSQNPSDIPKGLSSVINTKMFFKGDAGNAKLHGVSISHEEMESLKKGYAAVSIHELSQLKILKIPMAYAGVFDQEVKNG